jgi:hypothetical protein
MVRSASEALVLLLCAPCAVVAMAIPAIRSDFNRFHSARPWAPEHTHLLARLTLARGRTRPSAKNAQARAICDAKGGAEAFWTALRRETTNRGLLLGLQLHHPLDA